MKGMQLQEWMLMKSSLKSYLPLLLFMQAMACMTAGHVPILPVAIQYAAIGMAVQPFTYDKQVRWDKFARALPVERKELVGVKYCFGMLPGAINFVIAQMAWGILALFDKQSIDFVGWITYTSLGMVVFWFILAVTYPMIFCFGPEKGQYLGLLCGGLLFFVFVMGVTVAVLQDISLSPHMFSPLFVLAMVFVSLGLLYGSFRLSSYWDCKREV